MAARALLALAVATATLATALPGAPEEEEDRRVQALFHRWVREYRPPYADRRTAAERREWSHRLGVFRANLRSFEEHNSNHAERTGITQGVTPFADQTEEEWAQRFHGMRTPEPAADAELAAPFVSDPAFVAPVSVDWRKPTPALPNGALPPVKNQANCGGCWDFAAIAALEGANAIASGKLTALSEQEVLDCCNMTTGPHPCWGCKGGAPIYAFGWIKDNGGIDAAADYPYVSGKNDKVNACNATKAKRVVAKVASAVSLPRPAPEATMMEALAKGPVAISIAVSGGFRGYKSGVLSVPPPACRQSTEALTLTLSLPCDAIAGKRRAAARSRSRTASRWSATTPPPPRRPWPTAAATGSCATPGPRAGGRRAICASRWPGRTGRSRGCAA